MAKNGRNCPLRRAAGVTQKLAGHSDIKTTLKYYISVQPEDLERARTVQADILRGGLTDPKVTHSAENEGVRSE